jgi:hypothetical protein
VSTALSRYLEINRQGVTDYLVPWFVRSIRPADGITLIFMAGEDDPWSAEESPEVIAQRLLDCQEQPGDEGVPAQ